MKPVLFAILLLALLPCKAQYYLRGEVRDEQNKLLPNVKICLASKGALPFATGSGGAFGIPTSRPVDTISLQLEGFETLKTAVISSKYQTLVLKQLPQTAAARTHKLLSFSKSKRENKPLSLHDGESYNNLIENNFQETESNPETGFALNVDRASYSNIRRFLNMDYEVPPDAVRIEEMLNYFDFGSPDGTYPEGRFTSYSALTSAPWNKKNQLLFVRLQAPKLNLDSVPPSNLVFLIDASGSMDHPNRLPLLQAALRLLVTNLRAQDSVSIVVYGGNVSVLLEPTSGADKKTILNAIDQPSAHGTTPGSTAIKLAYQMAHRSFMPNGNNRVIIATDGDFNVGQTSEKELETLISEQRESGIYLTCLGMGMGNYKDSKLETLARYGNGNFAYLDNINEAEKVLVSEFTKTMYAVANDAFLNIRFNPQFVKSYRLIGFDNREEALKDSTAELEGGIIGSGHGLIAMFEIVPNEENNNQHTDDSSNTITIGRLATMTLHYQRPHQLSEEQVQHFTVPFHFEQPALLDPSLRLATAITMFGELLKHSRFVQNYTWTDVLQQATAAADPKSAVQMEFIALVQKAQKLYTRKKKKDDQ
ncbi:vWA domain-containing protein [Deminuibacter soli]|uniref:VWA domain-containing protein n=1 Tax=Deminuibacter soli TaxID=2291815 RepID=A0A3E1NDL5_9BACT|nr:VWA domain-containing protein [Deminuibacter soli]RFM26059.1 VWA domain-containing protein [Deminuibacter soli]